MSAAQATPPGVYRGTMCYWAFSPTYQHLVADDFGALVALTGDQSFAMLAFQFDDCANTAAEHAFMDAQRAYGEAAHARIVAVRAEEAAHTVMLALLPPGVSQ